MVTLYVESLFQWALNTFNWRAGAYDGKAYQGELRENSDYRRFDDTLRMVLDCSPDEVAAMEAALVGAIEAGGTKFVCAVGRSPGDFEAVRFPTLRPEETISHAIDFFKSKETERKGATVYVMTSPADHGLRVTSSCVVISLTCPYPFPC